MSGEGAAFIVGVILASILWITIMVNYTTINKTLIEKGCMEYNKTTGELQFKER